MVAPTGIRTQKRSVTPYGVTVEQLIYSIYLLIRHVDKLVNIIRWTEITRLRGNGARSVNKYRNL